MGPVFYTVQTINGDYAYLSSDTGVEQQTAIKFGTRKRTSRGGPWSSSISKKRGNGSPGTNGSSRFLTKEPARKLPFMRSAVAYRWN